MILIIYDSVYGNTEKVAFDLLETLLALRQPARALKVQKVFLDDLNDVDLFVIGSPTHAFRVTAPMESFLKTNMSYFTHKKVALFDTRIDPALIKSKILHVMVKRFGYANDYLSKKFLRSKAILVGKPMGFIVKEERGQLMDVSATQVKSFAQEIIDAIQK